MAAAFWVGPLCVSSATVIPSSPAVSPSCRRWLTTVRRLGRVGGLPRPRDRPIAAPNQRAAERLLRWSQLEAVAGPDIGAPDVAAADLDPVAGQVIAEGLGGRVVGLLGDHGRLVDDQSTEVVAPARQLEVLDPGLADPLDGRPDSRGAVAVGETAQDALHRDRLAGCGRSMLPLDVSSRLIAPDFLAGRSGVASGGAIGSRATGTSVWGSTTRRATRPVRTSRRVARRPVAATPASGRGTFLGLALAVPADQALEIVRGADEPGSDLVLGAALRQGRGEQVHDHRLPRPFLVTIGGFGQLIGWGRASVQRRSQRGSRRSWRAGAVG